MALQNRVSKFGSVAAALAVAVFLSVTGASSVSALESSWSISSEASSRQAAINRVNSMCNQGAPVGHAGYVDNLSFNKNTGVISWSVTTLNRRCKNIYIRGYAVIGYNGICPLAGWYNPDGTNTYDCVKYEEPRWLSGYNLCNGGRWGSYSVNNCSQYGNHWKDVYRGSADSRPPTSLQESKKFYFSAQVPNWSTAKLTSGSYDFVQGKELCGSYTLADGFHGQEWCQYINATVRWTTSWNVSGQSYVGNQGRVNGNNSNAVNRKTGELAIQNARPGTYIRWDHELRNTGPDPMDQDVTINIDNAVYSAKNGGSQLSFSSSPAGMRDRGGVNELFYTYRNGAGRKVTQGDVGRRLCQRIAWQKKSSSNSGWGTSTYACAYVPYHYPGRQGTNEPSNQFSDCTQTGTCPNTTPKGGIQLSTSVAGGQTTIMPGESVKFNYTLSNSGPTKSKGLTYRAYTFILKGGTGLPSNSNHMSTYPAGWQNVDCNSTNVSSGNHGTCLMGKNGSGLVIDPSTPKSITSDSYTIANEWLGNPGDQICSYIAVDNNWSVYNDTPANSYAVSNVACVKIGKKPQIQINGSDSYAKNGFTGGNYTDIAINTNRGSYSQYGLLTGSNGSITNFGTAGYTNISNTNKTKACKLAYANTTGLTNTNCSLLGKAGINRTISIPTKMNAGNVVSTELNVGDVGAGGSNLGNAYYRANGDLEIHGTLKEGNRITVYVDGNVTITDNIDTVNGETGRYDALSQIPSLTLVAAGDIRISSNVTLVNANLVAMNGSLHTCYNATNEDLGLVSKCSNKLKINGAVISKNSPKLLRTFGSGNISNYINQWDTNTTSSTSEWFNYTPNSWLVPNVGSMNSAITGYNTVSISDLPARY